VNVRRKTKSRRERKRGKSDDFQRTGGKRGKILGKSVLGQEGKGRLRVAKKSYRRRGGRGALPG